MDPGALEGLRNLPDLANWVLQLEPVKLPARRDSTVISFEKLNK